MKPIVLVAALVAVVTASAAQAQSADAILVNGKVITLDPRSSVAQAIAIRDGKVLATGTDEDVRKRADAHTKVVDLGGRTVIPGLMDSHIHALRAGLTYAVEVSWIGVPSLAKGLDIIREAARTAKPGAWIKIGGGWTELQFPEKRGPTVAELVAAAPDRPVYVQRLYNTAWITPAGVKLMGLTPDDEDPRRQGGDGRRRQPHRRVHRRQRHLQLLHRQDSRADLRGAARRHEEIFPRAQPARHDRGQRLPRRRHAAGAFPRGADAVAERRAELARDVPHLRRPARRLQGAHRVHADELRRRLAALPRHRRIAHPRHL